jgi:glycosyltransferase involved in cell wall biosynthesis
MRKRVMIIMGMSSLDGQRSFGGVDSACQAHFRGLSEITDDSHDYIILAFNQKSDSPANHAHMTINGNTQIFWCNYRRKIGKMDRIPNVIRNELLIRNFIRRFKPDIVHSHLPQWHIRKYSREIKILTLHQYHNIARTPAGLMNDILHRDIIEPSSIRSANIVTSVSQDLIRVVKDDMNIRARYVPNAINDHYLREKRQCGQGERINLLMMGTLCLKKRVMDALEVVRRLKSDHPSITLTLAGAFGSDLDFERQCFSFISDHALQDNVRFPGVLNLAEMKQQMSQTHIALFLSEQETFGLAPLECLAAGIPLVTTKVGVFKWQTEDFARLGVDVAEVGDIPGITQAVSRKIKSNIYDAGKGIRDFLFDNFSPKACAMKYHGIYASL